MLLFHTYLSVSCYRLQIYDFLVKIVRFTLTFYKLLDEKPRFSLSSSVQHGLKSDSAARSNI